MSLISCRSPDRHLRRDTMFSLKNALVPPFPRAPRRRCGEEVRGDRGSIRRRAAGDKVGYSSEPPPRWLLHRGRGSDTQRGGERGLEMRVGGYRGGGGGGGGGGG